MRRRRWLIPMVLSIVLIGGITGGMIAAADNTSDSTAAQGQTDDRYQELLDRACVIYQENTGAAIDSEQFKAALDQAQGELQAEALESRLQDLVENGKMTQEEADSYLEWWQSRPDIQVPLPGLGGSGPRRGMMCGGGHGPRGGQCFATYGSNE